MSKTNSTRPLKSKELPSKKSSTAAGATSHGVASNYGITAKSTKPSTGVLPSKKSSQPKQQNGERQIVHDSAFSIIYPDEKKRQQILKQARKEEDAYEAHKRSSRLTHISEPPRRLGSGHDRPSIAEVRSRQEQLGSSAADGPFRAAEKRRALRNAAKKEEEKKLVEMKEEARRKTERREAKGPQGRAVDADALRAKRLDFLGV